MNIEEENYLGDKMNYLLEALCKKLEGEIEVAKANVMVYQRNSVGIGEHPDVVEAIETQVSKIAEAEDKLDTIKRHFK
jgi:hypothetical protein